MALFSNSFDHRICVPYDTGKTPLIFTVQLPREAFKKKRIDFILPQDYIVYVPELERQYTTPSFSIDTKDIHERTIIYAVISSLASLIGRDPIEVSHPRHGVSLCVDREKGRCLDANITTTVKCKVDIANYADFCRRFSSYGGEYFFDNKKDFRDNINFRGYMFDLIQGACAELLSRAFANNPTYEEIGASIMGSKNDFFYNLSQDLADAGLLLNDCSLTIGEPFGEGWENYRANRIVISNIEADAEILEGYARNAELASRAAGVGADTKKGKK